MNHSNKSASYDNASDSPYSLRPTASIYAVNDQRSNPDTTAGGPRYTSTPSDSNHALSSSPSLTDRRQDIPPQSSPAALQGPSITELTPTAVQNYSGFGGNGDPTYPPIRPPIGENGPREIGRPNIIEETNDVIAKWDAFDRQRQRHNDPASTGPIQVIDRITVATFHLPAQERFVGLASSNTVLDPASFADPEHQVHSLDGDMESSNDSPQQCRLLSKREVNRRLNAQFAGMGYDREPSAGPEPAAGRYTQGPKGPALTAAVVRLPPSSQVGARGTMRLTSLSAVVVSAGSPYQVSARDTPLMTYPPVVLHRPSPAQATSIHSVELPVELTPRDMRYLEYVLAGRLSPDDPADWVRRTIADLERQGSARPVGHLVYPYQWKHLLCNGSESGGRTEGKATRASLEAGAGEAGGLVITDAGQPSQGDLVLEKGEPDTTPPGSAEPAVRCTAGPDPSTTQHRRTRRGGRRQRTSSALTPSVVAGGGSHNSCGAQAPSPSPAPPAESEPVRVELSGSRGECTAHLLPQQRQDRPQGAAHEASEDNSGGSMPDGELLDRPADGRRRRRGRRKGAMSPPSSTAGGAGGDNPRGVQPASLEAAAASCGSTDHGPGTLQALGEGAAASCGSTGHGTPASVSATPIRQVQKNMKTLSMRREFQGKRNTRRRALSVMPSERGLTVSVISGQRGRRGRRVETAGRLSPSGLHLPRLGTADFSRLGQSLARMGAKGTVSSRTGEYSHFGAGAWGDSEAVQGKAEEQAGLVAEPCLRHSGAAGTESWAARRKKRREGARWPVRPEEVGTVMQARSQAAPPMDSEADLGMGERMVLTGTRGDRDGNEKRRMLPICEVEEVGTEEQVAATDVPTSIEAWVVGGERGQMVTVTVDDWGEMGKITDGMGVGVFPELAVGLALRRSAGPGRMPTIRLVERDGIDLPKHSWPTSWDGLVEHVGKGGFFRRAAALRGGMNPDEARQLLANTTLDETLPWPEIDRLLADLRSGIPVAQEELQAPIGRIAQALTGSFPLQQYEVLAALLASLPRDATIGTVVTPARLAATAVEALKSRPVPAELQEWVTSANYASIRFHHLSPNLFGLDPHLTSELRAQLEDAVVNRILNMVPAIKDHTHFRMQDMRDDIRLEINYKSVQANTLFSATMVLPSGQWVKDLVQGTVSMGGSSFCTITPVDLYVETALSPVDQQVLRALQTALGVDSTTFRLMMDASFSAACLCDVRTRDASVRYVPNGARKTMEHVDPGSPESSILITLDGKNLMLARRTETRLALRVGLLSVGFNVMQCPHQAQQRVLKRQEQANLRERRQGTMVDTSILLIGPLPKGTIAASVAHSGAKMAEMRYQMHSICKNELQTRDARLVGKYEKDRNSPMFLYLEWSSPAGAQQFLGRVDQQQTPPGFQQLMRSLTGDKQVEAWSSSLLAETLATADEKDFKYMMAQGQAHACPLPPPPPYMPPPPAPQEQGGGMAGHGTGSAAGGPDNPGGVQH